MRLYQSLLLEAAGQRSVEAAINGDQTPLERVREISATTVVALIPKLVSVLTPGWRGDYPRRAGPSELNWSGFAIHWARCMIVALTKFIGSVRVGGAANLPMRALRRGIRL